MNTIHIIGSVGANPEMRATSKGTPVCTFNVATNEKRGEAETTTWFKVTAWAKLAEVCNRYVSKGMKIMVSGSVSASAYTRKNGEVACSLEINARDVEFLGGRKSDADDTGLKVPEGFAPVKEDDPDFLPF